VPALSHHDELFPLVLTEWQGEATDAELQAHFAQLDAWGHSELRRVVVYDLSASIRVGHGQRQLFAEWIRRNDVLLRTMNLAVLFVITSPVVRIIVRAVLFAQPLPCPTRTFARREDALAHAASLFEAEGNHLSALRVRRRCLGAAAPRVAPLPGGDAGPRVD
jgi:hypothetical protein